MRDKSCKTCKSVNTKLFLKAKKCFTSSCPLEKRKPKFSNKYVKRDKPYLAQIKEKRKTLSRYNITFSQLKKYFIISKKKSLKLDNIIESRLDNLVYRSSFAPNIRTSRQIINHGFVTVNGKRCNIPSRLITTKDFFEVKTNNNIFYLSEKPEWLSINETKVNLLNTPNCIESFINFSTLSEFLSRYV